MFFIVCLKAEKEEKLMISVQLYYRCIRAFTGGDVTTVNCQYACVANKLPKIILYMREGPFRIKNLCHAG